MVLALLGCWQLEAQSPLNQRISIQADNLPLERFLYQLIEESSIALSFRNDQIPPGVTVNLRLRRQPLAIVLSRALEGTGLGYELIGSLVVILPLPPPPPESRFTISGYIADEASGERLIGANITDALGQRGTASNEYGFFSLTLPAGEVLLVVSYLGYESYRQWLNLSGDIRLNLRLSANSFLPEVVVTPKDTGSWLPSNGVDRQAGDLVLITRELPSLAGEPDPVRTMHLLPGIHTGADGIEGLHIRGGDPGQNLVLIDGVPVYNISHAAGIFSVFNAGAIRSANLLSGGFPARYGGRLSGVIDVYTKDGNQQRLSGSAELGLITGRVSLEGPVIKERTTFFISARQSFLRHYLTPYTRDLKAKRDEKGETDYRFYDINAKVSHTFSPKDRLYFSFYKGADGYADGGGRQDQVSIDNGGGQIFDFDIFQSYGERINWGNTVGALRWNHLFSDKVFANLTLSRSELSVRSSYRQYDSIALVQTGQYFRALTLGRFRTGIADQGFRTDVHVLPRPGQELRFGISYNWRQFDPGALEQDENSANPDDEPANDPISTRELNAYAEGQFDLGRRWQLNAGLHMALWQVRLRNYLTLQPRLLLSHRLSADFNWHLSASRMVQFVHLLSNSSIGLPTDLWVPATDKVAPAEAWVLTAGANWAPKAGWRLSVEAYYKPMRQLLSYSEGAVSFRDWEENVTSGEGQAYGMEWMLTKTAGRWMGWLSYTLAWANRRFDNINFGEVYPFKYDRRHDAKLSLTYRCRPWLRLSGVFVYNTGSAFSIPLEKYNVALPGIILPNEGVEVISFGGKNQYRLPPYHRLDLNAQFLLNRAGKLRHQITAGVYNAYDRKNPLYYNVRSRYVNAGNALISVSEFVQVWLLPALPSLSYKLEF